MRTQHVCLRKLVELSFFAVAMALYVGGCGEKPSANEQTPEHPYTDGGTMESEPMADVGTTETICDEPGGDTEEPTTFLGYTEPAWDNTPPTVVAAEPGGTSGPPDGMEGSDIDVVTPGQGGSGDDQMRTGSQEYDPATKEGCGFEDRERTDDQTLSMPVMIAPEDTSEPMRDTDEGCLEATPPENDDGNQTALSDNSPGVLSNRRDMTAVAEMPWTWIGGVRLVVSTWWQTLVTTPDAQDTRPHEGYIPNTSNDLEAGELTDDPTSGSPL